MSVLKGYLNQLCDWQRKESDDDYGDAVYSNTQSVSCRRVYKATLVRDKYGRTVASSTHYYTESPIAVDDKVDNEVVIGVESLTNLDGKVEGYKVYV